MLSVEEKTFLDKLVSEYGFTQIVSVLSQIAAEKADECVDMQLKERSFNFSELASVMRAFTACCDEIEGKI